MSAEKLNKPTPVRLAGATAKKLKIAESRFGLGQAELIRRAVDQKLDEWERVGMLTIQAKESRG